MRLSIPALCQLDEEVYESSVLSERKGKIACLATDYLMVLRLSDPGRRLQATDWSGDQVKRLIAQTTGGTVSEESSLIQSEIDQGRPVILGSNSPDTINHWVLITGYQGDRFLVHDPWTGESHIPLTKAKRYSKKWTTRFLHGIPPAEIAR